MDEEPLITQWFNRRRQAHAASIADIDIAYYLGVQMKRQNLSWAQVEYRWNTWETLKSYVVVQRMEKVLNMLKRWASQVRARVAFRPGGPGYLQARRRFMVNAGQSRRTRRYQPYT